MDAASSTRDQPPATAGSMTTVSPSLHQRVDEPTEEPHVLVVDVDVDEPAQVAGFD